ncbi:glyoxalase superfamily protein [Hymenobacter nivis]|uniref:VOC family protein n=1 Tax=Hymenobacter nivis TaxID=1850093 RepID=A0A502GYK0_9BACT|nr:glyoxalase superfamily protein [Hymenobacter nivis]TPG66043.1 VOC family protein [Hymenobacter nivis]
MVTPVFRILDYAEALAFYIEWLGFRIDWADRPAGAPAYLQVARADVVLHLSGHPTDGAPGSLARAEVQSLATYHHQLLRQPHPFAPPVLARAEWNPRVLEMTVIDPFGNRIVFCEPAGLSG